MMFPLALAVVGCGAYFVFNLCRKVYVGWIGITYGILALVPCFGLIILLTVNSKASGILVENGYKVGFLGAKLDEVGR